MELVGKTPRAKVPHLWNQDPFDFFESYQDSLYSQQLYKCLLGPDPVNNSQRANVSQLSLGVHDHHQGFYRWS